MGTLAGPKIVTSGLIFCADPANPKSFDVSTNALTDIVGNKSMTLGANTTDVTTYGVRHFASTAGETGSGSLDTGIRYGTISNGDKVVGGDTSFTIMFWVYRTTGAPNNWWHTITDGVSGDILTVQNGSSGSFIISMNSSSGGTGASGTYSGVNWASCKENSWNMIGVRYDISSAKIKAFVGNPDNGVTFSTEITTSPINTAFKIRNFNGWGSAQSSYHADNSFSYVIAYNTPLSNDEITENFNQIKARFI
tara:strand:- start:237 stop:989 length:753 start_codon:yes stop_codon:yes gene_type:complete